MNIGDIFPIVGYDIVATAQCDYGAVLVLNNNSTHYLVVESEVGGEDLSATGIHTVQRHPTALLVASYEYGEHLTATEAYRRALAAMARAALRNCFDEDRPAPEDDEDGDFGPDDIGRVPPTGR